MARTEKLSLALPKETLVWARERAKAAGVSLSAAIAEVLDRQRRHEAWEEWLAEAMEGEPPFTQEELDAAGRELAGLPPCAKTPADAAE